MLMFKLGFVNPHPLCFHIIRNFQNAKKKLDFYKSSYSPKHFLYHVISVRGIHYSCFLNGFKGQFLFYCTRALLEGGVRRVPTNGLTLQSLPNLYLFTGRKYSYNRADTQSKSTKIEAGQVPIKY